MMIPANVHLWNIDKKDLIPLYQYMEEGHEITKETVIVWEENHRKGLASIFQNGISYLFTGNYLVSKDPQQFLRNLNHPDDVFFHRVHVYVK